MSKKKILVTGGNGRFAKILKKNNHVLNLYFADKTECNILKFNYFQRVVLVDKRNTPQNRYAPHLR